ncbi:MAG: hypothetical protein QY309_15780 [Cyclobacteriaceae bacterium]|nr:MAG: hypothetical protein QY309_15780 [Cyclobacteriaceae bacterium]
MNTLLIFIVGFFAGLVLLKMSKGERKLLKSLLSIVILVGTTLLFSNCENNEIFTGSTKCLPTQFPFEEEEGIMTASYDIRNRLAGVNYTFTDDDDFSFTSIRTYSNDDKLTRINFYVNGNIADDFVQITHATDTIKEQFYRSSSSIENLQSYRYYFLDSNDKVISFAERSNSNNFAKGDSTVYTYTGKNITLVSMYNELEELEESYEIEYDDKKNPYFETKFSGEEYLFSIWNLSENNPVSIKHVQSGDITTYTYTFSEKGFLLTRQSSALAVTGEFKYNCDVD